jgi:uncharacterized membrane protein
MAMSTMSSLRSGEMCRRLETPEGVALQWQLKRNCSLTPRQFMGACFIIVAFNAVIGLAFCALGYPVIACFAALEAAVLLVCLLSHARHACDRETVTFHKDRVAVEVHRGGAVQRTLLHAGWVRIEAPSTPHGLVSLTERGIRVELGRHVQPRSRDVMAAELRRALRAYQYGSPIDGG